MCYVVYLCQMLVKCSNGSAEVVNRRLHKWTIIKNHEKHPSVYSDLPRKGTIDNFFWKLAIHYKYL